MENILSRVNPDFVIHVGDSFVSAADLRASVATAGTELEKLRGQTVAIHGQPLHMLEWMVALDGVVAQLVLIPYGACNLFVERVLQALPELVVVKDSSVSDGVWPTTQLWPSVAARLACSVGPEKSSSRWLISTSGTTSTPKLVGHSLESLARTVTSKTRQGKAVWGLLYDPARFAGLQVMLQALLGGGELVAPDPRLSLSEQIALFLRHQVNALSATPTLWRKLLMTPGATELPLRQITLGGEIADERTLNALHSTYSGAHITHIYASTEAGVGFAVHDVRAGFPAGWLNTGVKDVQLRISADSTLMIKPSVRAQAYANVTQSLFSDEGWLDTGDLVELVGDRILFRGRANGSINVGGNKVMPEEVENCILQLDFVSAALVRPKASSVAGSLLEALVVVVVGSSETKEAVSKIKIHCRERLAVYKVPAFVRVVDHLPMTAAGKLARGG